MSDADEKKAEDISFDLGSFIDDEETQLSSSMPTGLSDAGFGSSDEELPPSLGDPLDTDFGGPEAEFAGEMPTAESEFPAMPSSFLADNAEEPVGQEPITLDVGTPEKGKTGKRKKDKKQKSSKEAAGPREPMDIGSVLSFCLGFALFLGLIAINALIFTSQDQNAIGGSSKIYYAAVFNVFGLVIVAVPFLLWKFRKGNEPKKNLQLFEVLLGVSLMALTVGVICFLTAFFRYDFTMK